MMNRKLIFLIPFTFFFSYQMAWLLFRYMSWHWDSNLNIPGFFMLMLSYPWHYLSVNQELLHFLDASIGYYGRGIAVGALVSFGFALNILVVTVIGITLFDKVLNKLLEESDAKNARIN